MKGAVPRPVARPKAKARAPIKGEDESQGQGQSQGQGTGQGKAGSEGQQVPRQEGREDRPQALTRARSVPTRSRREREAAFQFAETTHDSATRLA